MRWGRGVGMGHGRLAHSGLGAWEFGIGEKSAASSEAKVSQHEGTGWVAFIRQGKGGLARVCGFGRLEHQIDHNTDFRLCGVLRVTVANMS
jgi:hypothetical protein